jgi:hypothetical protein
MDMLENHNSDIHDTGNRTRHFTFWRVESFFAGRDVEISASLNIQRIETE